MTTSTIPQLPEDPPSKSPLPGLMGDRQKRLNLGCGGYPLPNFLNIDNQELPGVDFCLDLATEDLPFASDSIEIIVAHHFIEHLTFAQAIALLKECHRVLVPDGKLSLVVPDFEAFVRLWNHPQFDRKYWIGLLLYPDEHGQVHKAAYSREMLTQAARAAGFTKAVLETPKEYLVADVNWQTGITVFK